MRKHAKSVLMALVLVIVLFVPASAATETYTVVEFGGSGYVPSSKAKASLKRKSDQVHMKINTDNLEPGDVYTVWAVVWNDPSLCSGSCGADDFGVSGASIFWVTGKASNSKGKVNFNSKIHEGPPAGYVIFGPGLTDAENAELHFIIRSHGQPIPGMVEEQLTTLNGGCEPGDPNVCADHQAAVP